MIYLDNAATTKMFDECAEVFKDFACKDFYNPSAGYHQAIEIKQKLNDVRRQILNALGCDRGSVIFTSGATESNNLAIFGSKRAGKSEYVFSSGEHPSVYNAAKSLESSGAIVHFAKLNKDGSVNLEHLQSLLNENTRLISIIHVNNQTGAINDLKAINSLRKKYVPKALFHVDGVQAFMKINFKVKDFDADLYTISAHKIHGPKGVGALYVKNAEGLKNINFGGGQEDGKRSGTENVPGIMALNKAISMIDVQKNYCRAQSLREAFIKNVECEGITVAAAGSPYIVNIFVRGVNGETLMRALEKDVIVGTGSACSTRYAGNRVLENAGYTIADAKSSLRISFNAYQSESEVISAAQILKAKYLEILEKVK